MIYLFLSLISAFFITGALIKPGSQLLDAIKEFLSKYELYIGLFIFIFTIGIFVTLTFKWPSYNVYTFLKIIVTFSAQSIFGLFLGGLLRLWWSPLKIIDFKKLSIVELFKKDKAWVTGIFSVILLLLILTYALLHNVDIQAIKTPILSVQLKTQTTTEKARFFKKRLGDLELKSMNTAVRIRDVVHRDLIILDTIWRGNEDDKQIRKSGNMYGAEFYDRYLATIFECINEATELKHNIETIRDAIRPLGQRLSHLITTVNNNSSSTKPAEVMNSFLKTVKTSETNLIELISNQEICKSSIDESQPTGDYALLKHSPHIHVISGLLLVYLKDIESAIDLLNEAAIKFPDDVNVNFNLAVFAYHTNKRWNYIISHFDQALDTAQYYAKNAKYKAMKDRYDDAVNIIKNGLVNALAYSGMRDYIILDYAEDVYEYNSSSPGNVDAFGFAKLAVGSRRSPTDFEMISEARALFKYGIELSGDNKYGNDYEQLISHLNEAEHLLRQK